MGFSVNDGIPKNLSSIMYITIDNAIQEILRLGRGTMLAKIDIKNAFRLLPVHPSDRHLLGMSWSDAIYIDTCLPFGLRSAPKLFYVMADLLGWILQQLNSYITSMAFSQWAPFFAHMPAKLRHYKKDLYSIGCPTCGRKGGRTNHITLIFRNSH